MSAASCWIRSAIWNWPEWTELQVAVPLVPVNVGLEMPLESRRETILTDGGLVALLSRAYDVLGRSRWRFAIALCREPELKLTVYKLPLRESLWRAARRCIPVNARNGLTVW